MAKTCCCIWRADNNYAIVPQSGFDQGYTTKNKKITVCVFQDHNSMTYIVALGLKLCFLIQGVNQSATPYLTLHVS